MDAITSHHKVVIVGGGTAGIAVAARLRRKKIDDIVIIEPSDQHFYQPLWTLVGADGPRRSRRSGPSRS